METQYRIVIGVVFALILFASITYVGSTLGIEEDQRITLVGFGLLASFIYGVCTAAVMISGIGLVFSLQ